MAKSTLISLAMLLAPAAFATQIFTLTGTFSSNTPDTELLTPNVPFSAVFSVADMPVSSPFSSNQANVSAPTTYTLNGSTLTAYSPTLTMWTSGAGGGFSLIFWESNNINRIRLNVSGPVMFTGPTSAPVLIPGLDFSGSGGSWSYHNLNGSIIDAGSLTNVSVTTTPEPGATALVACGLGLCGWIGRRRPRQAA